MQRFIFEPSRFLKVLMLEIASNSRKFLSETGGAAAVIMIIFILTAFSGNAQSFFQNSLPVSAWFGPLLFIGGLFLSTRAFHDIHQKDQSYLFFMLPASTLEKLAARTFLYAVLFPVYVLLFLFLLSSAASLVHLIFFGSAVNIVKVFSSVYLKITGIYIITQSMFIYASVHFRKNAFFKFSMITAVLQFAVMFYFLFLARVLFWEFIPMTSFSGNIDYLIGDFSVFKDHFLGWFHVLKFIFFYLLAPFFWFLSLVKLEESEV